MFIKELPFDYTPHIKKYKKNHKRFFTTKQRKINISAEYSLDLKFCIISRKNRKLTKKHFQCVYKKLKKDIKDDSLVKHRLYCRSLIYPTITSTKKPRDIRMGRGKGLPMNTYADLRQGYIFLNLFYFSTILYFWLLEKIRINLPFSNIILIPKFW